MGNDREFENSMREYNVAGTSIYRFDKNDRNSSNRASVLAPAKYSVKKGILDRTYKAIGKPIDGDDYKRDLAKLDAEWRPFTEEEYEQFRILRGGGRKFRKTRRQRKSRKYRKSRRSRKSRRTRK